MRKLFRKATALLAAATVALSSAADFPCGFAEFGFDITASAESACAHTNITDNVCTDCKAEMAAAVFDNNKTAYVYFATVEEAVTEANNNEKVSSLYFIEDYTGNIDLTRANANITLNSLGNTPVTITGNITFGNYSTLKIQDLTVNGSVTAEENATLLTINDGANVNTVTSNCELSFNGGSAKTVNAHKTFDFYSGTVTDINIYYGALNIYAATNIKGTVSILGYSNIFIMENITNPIKIKDIPGSAATLMENADPSTFDISLITSADGYEVKLKTTDVVSFIEFICDHNLVDGSCTICGRGCIHENFDSETYICSDCGQTLKMVYAYYETEDSEAEIRYLSDIEEFVEKINSMDGYQITGMSMAPCEENISINSDVEEIQLTFINGCSGDITVSNSGTAETKFLISVSDMSGNITTTETVALALNGNFSGKITANGRFATLTLPEGTTIRDVYAMDERQRQLCRNS